MYEKTIFAFAQVIKFL